jgi:Ser-tRNA(Ala) deacylase AlaX
MAKKPISKAELAKLIRHRMDEYPECPPGVSVEIRKVKTSEGPGWSAVTNPSDSITHVKCARIVGALTLELRQKYALSDE